MKVWFVCNDCNTHLLIAADYCFFYSQTHRGRRSFLVEYKAMYLNWKQKKTINSIYIDQISLSTGKLNIQCIISFDWFMLNLPCSLKRFKRFLQIRHQIHLDAIVWYWFKTIRRWPCCIKRIHPFLLLFCSVLPSRKYSTKLIHFGLFLFTCCSTKKNTMFL